MRDSKSDGTWDGLVGIIILRFITLWKQAVAVDDYSMIARRVSSSVLSSCFSHISEIWKISRVLNSIESLNALATDDVWKRLLSSSLYIVRERPDQITSRIAF